MFETIPQDKPFKPFVSWAVSNITVIAYTDK
jgi:hypothetical protein